MLPALRVAAPFSGGVLDERRLYRELFSPVCQAEAQRLYQSCLDKLRGVPFADSSDALEALSVLQELFARALWKHGCVLVEPLDKFTRDFDRLDLQEEQERLHRSVQGSPH